MKKRVAILTLYGNGNFGNKLQNYAVQEILKGKNIEEIITIKNSYKPSFERKIKKFIKKILFIEKRKSKSNLLDKERLNNFLEFDKLINTSDISMDYDNPNKKFLLKNFDVFVIGSDQVWNPSNSEKNDKIVDLFSLNDIKEKKKIAFSASIGVEKLPQKAIFNLKKTWDSFDKISVREEEAKKLIEKYSNRNGVVVLLDPTMILEKKYWDKVLKKPKQINQNNKKYILNYFLGNFNEKRKIEIERIAEENGCKIINILDETDPFYTCGPSEFLWLEKNAFLVCTDSFHSAVFAILYKTPFIVFNRDDGQLSENCTSSRLKTLLNKFKLEDRYCYDKIPDNLLNYSYKHVDKILLKERIKANIYLDNALK